MAARQNRRDQARWAASGMTTIPVDIGMELFGEVLRGSVAQIGVVPVNWPRMLERYPGLPLLRDLQPGGAVAGKRSEFLEKLDAEAPEKRHGMLVAYVIAEVSQVLGLKANEPVPMDLGFFELGVDSLTAMELRNRFQGAFNCALPTTLMFNYPTLADLIGYIAESVLGLGAEVPATRTQGDPEHEVPRNPAGYPDRDAGSAPNLAAAAIGDLSSQEVADMLRQTLAEVQVA
jgi:acyl carrier protein